VLSFRLGSEEYGIDILRVQEIRSFETCTHLANTPGFIKGVVNLRGVIVPIIDLRLKFGLAEAAFNDSTVTIVLTVAGRVVGVVVDSVSDVLQLRKRRSSRRRPSMAACRPSTSPAWPP
jgi:purine-binding chemotaxis protein CheW